MSQPRDPRHVAVVRTSDVRDPDAAPFSPSEAYPEYEFGDLSSKPNPAYAAVRRCLMVAGLDNDRYGRPDWNPLGEMIEPGETVLLKPNMIKESHPRDPHGWRYVMTHGSVIRAVADYAWKAVGTKGRVAVGDAPQTDSSFDAIVGVIGLAGLTDFYAACGRELNVIDFRKEEWTARDGVPALCWSSCRIGFDPPVQSIETPIMPAWSTGSSSTRGPGQDGGSCGVVVGHLINLESARLLG